MDKLWELDKRIKNDRKNPDAIMDMRKSDAIWNIIDFIRLSVITYDGMEDFSNELKQTVDLVLGRNINMD